MNKEIDIIIPAYNAHNTIGKTLASIASQTISDLISVTIVNDCSEKDYSEFIQMYSPILDIHEIKLEKNVGCGIARQIGLDITYSKYIMFVDADDLLANPFSVFILYTNIEKGNNGKDINIVYGAIDEVEIKTSVIKSILPPTHGTWLFGSIYRRSFIEDNHIRFNDSSRGEDISFNKICKLLSDPEQMGLVDSHTYLWTDANENRINNQLFRILYAKIGFIENILYVYDFIGDKTHPNFTRDDLKLDAISNFVSLYFQYQELIEGISEIKDKISMGEIIDVVNKMIDLYKELYDLNYTKYKDIITDEDVSFVYNINLERILNRGNLSVKGVSFYDFLDAFDTGNQDSLKHRLLDVLK